MRRTVVHIVHDLQVGGVEVAVKSSIDYLNEYLDFYILCIGIVDESFVEGIQNRNKIVHFPGRVIGDPIQFIRISNFIRKLKPDIVISSLWKSHFISYLLLKTKSCSEVIPMFHSATFRHSLDGYFSKLVLRKSRRALSDSKATKEHIEKICPSVANTILSFLTEKICGRERHFVTGEIYKMVAIGRLHKIKRIDRIIKMCASFAVAGLNFMVDIYGPDQGEKEKLLAFIEKEKLEKYVALKGVLLSEKVAPALAKYDFFLQMSDIEGMSISVAQAMMSGLVPIVTNVGEIQNYAISEKNAILLTPPFDAHLDDFTERLLVLMADGTKLNLISQEAMKTFVNQITYKESLLDYLNGNQGIN